MKKVEAHFSYDLNLDSLISIRDRLQEIGIILHYKKIEFNIINTLEKLSAKVICNDGYSGSFIIEDMKMKTYKSRQGFYRDYSEEAKSPFGTGVITK